MFKKIGIIALASTLAAGCASVPMESKQITKVAKQFYPPSVGRAGLYIYRNTGAFLYRNVWVDGKCIGTTVPSVFFYEEVEGGKSHKVSSKSEFSPNDLLIKVKSGMHYFIRQYIKFRGTGIELVEEEQGKEEVSELDMATKGACRKPRIYDGTPLNQSTNITFSYLNTEIPDGGTQLNQSINIGKSLCGLLC